MLSRTTLSRSIPHRWINPSPRIPRYPLDQLAYSHRENNLIYSQTNWTPFWRACWLALWRWSGSCRPPLERQSSIPLGANRGRDGRQVHCNPGNRVAGESSGGVHHNCLRRGDETQQIFLAAVNRRGQGIQCRVSRSPMVMPHGEVSGALFLMEELNETGTTSG